MTHRSFPHLQTTTLSRRRLLQALGTAGLLGLAPGTQAETTERSVTCFYQFGKAVLDALRAPEGLPNGPGYLHILSHSHPGMNPHPDAAKSVRAAGTSFRYAMALDVHKYKGWTQATDDQLRQWAEEFRAVALDSAGPADYFAFNEMPTTGAATPNLREKAAKWLGYLYEAGGGPRLPGVFYFTERNLNPANWQGDADAFWEALDRTCDLVVGEHYHSYDFELQRTPAQLAEHLFALPKWLEASGKPAQASIARRKYMVLHSSYYGPEVTGWAGVDSTKRDGADLDRYYEHLLAGTRLSPYGKRRIGFGPLAARNLDNRTFPALARALGKDLRATGS